MRKTSGFTLIELMIVAAIIAIVASIIYPLVTGKGRSQVDLASPAGGNVVPDQPATREGDNTTCVGGIAHHYGKALIVNGNTIKC